MYTKLSAGSILALSAGKALAGGVQWAGVNMAGMDFGCDTTVGHLYTILFSKKDNLMNSTGKMCSRKSRRSPPPIQRRRWRRPDEAFRR